MLGSINIMLVSENTGIVSISTLQLEGSSHHIPNGHARPGHTGQLDCTRETLVTLGVIVLEADL